MKKSLFILFLAAMALSFTGCGKTEKEKALDLLQETLLELNSNCPQTVDDITVWTHSDIDNGYFIYYYSVDESQGDETIGSLKLLGEAYKEQLKRSLKMNSEFDEFQDAVIKAGLGIIYTYTGSNSGEIFDVVFPPEEVPEL